MPVRPIAEEVMRRDKILDDAVSILAVHVPDEQGWCAGCLDLWHRLMPHPSCPHARWALSAVEAFGAWGHKPASLDGSAARPVLGQSG